MRFLNRFTQSHDPRWPRPLHYGPFLYLPISIAVIIITIFSVVQLVWAAVFQDKYGNNYSVNAQPGIYYEASQVSYRVGYAFGVFLYPLIIELIHLPTMIYFYARPSVQQRSPSSPPTPRHRLHPIAPLVLSFCLAAVWGWHLMFRLIVDWSRERELLPGWSVLTYLSLALMGCVTCAYLALMGFSCAAVHRWRVGRKKAVGADEERGGDVELQKL